jgi:hypothetical protein
VNGLIVTNTTIKRPVDLKNPNKSEEGGLSGEPLKDMSLKTIADMYKLTKGKTIANVQTYKRLDNCQYVLTYKRLDNSQYVPTYKR